jgi:pimeloyl-ACP methyl ester carboxylesterase
MLLAVVGVAAVAAFVWRAKYMHDLTRLTMSRRVLGADGVVIGGEGFVLDRADAPAVLLLHGGGDTPQTLRYLAGALHARGFHVAAPLLPGHGRSVRDFARVTADQLIDATHRSYHDLKTRHEWVAVIGLSMGGALAANLAAGVPDLRRLGWSLRILECQRASSARRVSHGYGACSFPRYAPAMRRRFSIRRSSIAVSPTACSRPRR